MSNKINIFEVKGSNHLMYTISNENDVIVTGWIKPFTLNVVGTLTLRNLTVINQVITVPMSNEQMLNKIMNMYYWLF